MDQIEAKLVNAQKENNVDVVIMNLSKRMDQMEKRLNEEQKEDKMETMMNEMKSLKQAMSELAAKTNANPKAEALKAWLENKVGYPQYYDLFIENGIEDL